MHSQRHIHIHPCINIIIYFFHQHNVFVVILYSININLTSFNSKLSNFSFLTLHSLPWSFQTPDMSHSVVSTTTFRAEYRRSSSASMFSRNVRFQVDISPSPGYDTNGESYCLTFTLISGNIYLFLGFFFFNS